ncbi:carbon-nitrogen hydrolase family protein [Agrobacterium rosae]|uniref:carbon-nitrogen hydrolase family protein n=1 Tax=Agrobacterium rosae TaxID=1972867 RepID=UPI0019D35FE7|nr:carbon-nitrogen hydrolase family protein [Agrobacterium rosae]MBN7809015.1 carbon-nitrogen hydrolase family protein [Agrobacterium rosae]
MKIAFIESPTDIEPEDIFWDRVVQFCEDHRVGALLLNEMPVGRWLAEERRYSAVVARESSASHDRFIRRFQDTPFTVLGTRAVVDDPVLANEAFSLDHNRYQPAHRKAYFPSETGFFETAWFQCREALFAPISVEDINFGFLICTELMFTEAARTYAKQDAHVILVPRATGGNLETWKTAASMAAIVSGSYVLSSNRTGISKGGVSFNGGGFAFGPDGRLIDQTTIDQPFKTIELDIELVTRQRREYPCYITLASRS